MGRDDTIFALASGAGKAAIAVIRLSGPASRDAVAALTAGRVPAPRRVALRRLRDPVTGATLDEALVLLLPGPGSFTGEDGAELHIHGGPAVKAAILRVLGGLPGLRAAEPGEFTRRAFLAGRLDLSAVEGLADLIEAETEAQRVQALRQLEGALAVKVASWRERLLESAALLEASFDFSDQDDIPEYVAVQVRASLSALRTEIDAELARGHQGERLREGFVAVIAGPPNAGKSTLLNAIAGRDVAIVSPFAGTTRDAIELRCDLGGLPVTFVDTAGLREAGDAVEQEGIARARRRAAEADLVLWLEAADATEAPAPETWAGELLRLTTKSDLLPTGTDGVGGDLAVSAATGAGVDSLLDAVRLRAEAALTGSGDALVTRERHRRALIDLRDALVRADAAYEAGGEEMAAEDLRLGARALGRITGQVDVEDVLDRVFSSFCIGK